MGRRSKQQSVCKGIESSKECNKYRWEVGRCVFAIERSFQFAEVDSSHASRYPLHHPDISYATGKKVTVQTGELAPWQVDGDSIGIADEMKIACVPKSLCVMS